MHAIVVSLGTDGDVLPFVGLAIRLKARGHRVTLTANQHFEPYALRHGFAFRALVTDTETNELIGNPDVWHPVKSAFLGARWARRTLARQYEVLAELARDEDAVLVAYPPVFAARLVHEKMVRPLAGLVVMPWMILSAAAPPEMAGAFKLAGGTPRAFVRAYWWLMERMAQFLIGRHVNRLGQSLGLKPIRSIYRWSLSPQLVVGLFPDWYAPPQPDWPAQIRLAGFPRFDGGTGGGVPRDVLGFCAAGPPPIAVTFGSGMMHGSGLFRSTIQACERLGARAVLLTQFGGQLPESLPAFVHRCERAPFTDLFPRCSAVVHHGGVGTTARALEAGVPQLVLPMAWDQADNAARIGRLGAGYSLSPHSNARDIASALARLSDPTLRDRCRAVAGKFRNEDAFDLASQWIEGLAGRNGQLAAGRNWP